MPDYKDGTLGLGPYTDDTGASSVVRALYK